MSTDVASRRAPALSWRLRFGGPLVATAAFATLWLPWMRTGTTERSAFRVVAALRAAGLLQLAPARLFYAAIAFLPGAVAVAWLMAGVRVPRLAAIATTGAGLLTSGTALGVRRVAHHRAAVGTTLGLWFGLAAVVTGTLIFVISAAAGAAPPRADSHG